MIVLFAVIVVVGALWTRNYYETRDVERATEDTSERAIGVVVGILGVLGVVFSTLITAAGDVVMILLGLLGGFGGEIADLVGEVGTALAGSPEILTHLGLGALGYARLTEAVLFPATWLLVASVVFLAAYYAVRRSR